MPAMAVGPVLRAGTLSAAIVAALQAANPGAAVVDRGGYLRVSAPGRLRLARADVEALLGSPVVLGAALQQVMTGYAGRLALTDDTALWSED